MGFLRQEYWSGLPFPPVGDLFDAVIKPTSLIPPTLGGRFFTNEPPRKPQILLLTQFPGSSDSKESACNAGDWVLSLDWEDP